MKNINLQKIMVIIIILIFTSCGSEQQKNEEKAIIEKEPTELTNSKDEQVYYRVPTPDELYSLIKETSKDYAPNLMNPKDNSEKYTDKGKRSINLGIYTADLAYAAVYEDFQKAIDYFDIIFEMSNEIGFSSIFTETFLDRIKTNLSNSDSLINITNETYYSIVKYLENNDKQATLVLNSAGGWLESMYITANLVGDYKKNDEGVQRIIEQKFAFENLIKYMEEYKTDEDVASYLDKMQPLSDVFAKIETVEVKTETPKTDGDKIVIGAGKKLDISKENYDLLKSKIEEVRADFIK